MRSFRLRLLAWLFLVVLFLPATLFAAEATGPNVVIVLADDLGFADLGCYGSEIDTPHLDRLAAGGLRFSQFYNTARCWTSRASLMTGLYPHQARMAMNYGDKAPTAYTGLVPRQCRMIPELLAERGYRSYHVGKWHLNRGPEQNPTWPLGRGFAQSYFLGDHNNYFAPNGVWSDERRLPQPQGDYYVTDAFTDQAVGMLKSHRNAHGEEPFFLYLAYTAPHFPLHALPADIARFRGKYRGGWDKLRETRHRRQKELGLLTCGLSPRDPDAKAWDSLTDVERDEWDVRMATYAAMIHAVDRGVGKVVSQLESMKALENTLILFLSDNGSSAEYIVRGEGHDPKAPPGSRKTFRCLEVGWSNAANTPFRMHKMWAHEGGISTPMIAHWPQGIRARGEITAQPGHLIDVLPTLLELTQASYPKSFEGEPTPKLPGRSLAAVFRGEAREPHPLLFWEHEGNRAVRVGDWKLVAEFDKPWELYDLKSDRCECVDLAGKQPDTVQDLAAKWTEFAKQIGVIDWSTFPQSRAKKGGDYRKK